jgi:hypothetical protein
MRRNVLENLKSMNISLLREDLGLHVEKPLVQIRGDLFQNLNLSLNFHPVTFDSNEELYCFFLGVQIPLASFYKLIAISAQVSS